LFTNTSSSLRTTLAAEAYVAEGQFSQEEQTLNKESLRYTEQEHEDQQFPEQKGRI
jgi:hypothetical protein